MVNVFKNFESKHLGNLLSKHLTHVLGHGPSWTYGLAFANNLNLNLLSFRTSAGPYYMTKTLQSEMSFNWTQ